MRPEGQRVWGSSAWLRPIEGGGAAGAVGERCPVDPLPAWKGSRSGQRSGVALLLAPQEEGTGRGHKPLGCGAGRGAARVGPWVRGRAEGRGGGGGRAQPRVWGCAAELGAAAVGWGSPCPGCAPTAVRVRPTGLHPGVPPTPAGTCGRTELGGGKGRWAQLAAQRSAAVPSGRVGRC